MATNTAADKAGSIPDGNWRVAPDSSRIAFRMRLFGVIPTKGGFRGFTGDLEVDSPRDATGQLLVEVASIETGNAKRDDHLRSEDFFEVEKYPVARFNLVKVSPVPGGVTISGTLRIRDREMPIHTPATVTPAAGDSLRIEATVDLDPRKPGFAFKHLPKSMRVQLDLTLDRVG
jgi:polyisoprenoid-binding protein YceI